MTVADPASDRVCVGAIGGAYGVKGEVRLKSFCADPAAIADYAPLQDEAGTRTFDVRLTGTLKGALSARLSGVPTKEAADALKGVRLYAPRDRLPPPDEDEYYHADLIGLTVQDAGGAEIGRVAAVLNHGAGDLLEVRGPRLKGSALIPFTREAVPTVDLTAGLIVADPPEGTLPET